VDILKDSRLDMPDPALSKLDIVVAAIHSYFDLPRETQTDRMIRAMNNPHVSVIAHPTGRLIGEREPYDIDMERVIAAARALGCHLEINAQPDRLDLNDMHIHAAKHAGVKLAISNAHSVDAFVCMRFGRPRAALLPHRRSRGQYEVARRFAKNVATMNGAREAIIP